MANSVLRLFARPPLAPAEPCPDNAAAPPIEYRGSAARPQPSIHEVWTRPLPAIGDEVRDVMAAVLSLTMKQRTGQAVSPVDLDFLDAYDDLVAAWHDVTAQEER